MYKNQNDNKDYPFQTLNELLIYRKEHQAKQLAYRFLINDQESEELSYQDLYAQVSALSSHLLQTTQPLDRIMLAAKPGFEFIVGFFACVLTRRVAVPIFPPANAVMANRFLHVLQNANPSLILCDRETTSSLNYAKLANNFLPGKLKQLVGLGESQAEALSSIRKQGLAFTSIAEHCKADSSKTVFPQCYPEDVAFLQYTSGSTNNPRGVMLSHENLLDNLAIIHHACQYSAEEHLCSWLPPYHDMGLIAGILSPLYEGMPATLMSTYDFIMRPSRWVLAMSKYACTRTGGPNFAYELCAAKTPDSVVATLDLSRLKAAANGAEPLNIKTLELFYQKFKAAGLSHGAMLPCYGLAESTVMCAAKPFMHEEKIIYAEPEAFKQHQVNLVSDPKQGKQLISSGTPFMELKIVHPERLEEVAANEIGEIWLHGKSIAKGYYNNPEETAKTFHGRLNKSQEDKHYLRTGDLGFMHEGELFVCGRIKHLIILHGQNFYPHDIEFAAASASEQIRTGCVVAYASQINDEECLAVVLEVQKNTQESAYPALCEQVQKALYKQLNIAAQQIYLVPARSLPKTTSGKLERHRCKELIESLRLKPLYLASQDSQVLPVEPKAASNTQQAWLVQLEAAAANERRPLLISLISSLCAKILALDEHKHLDPGKGFFELGFDSIKALEFKAELEDALENRLSLNSSAVFNYPSIAAISDYLLMELGYQPKTEQTLATTNAAAEEDIAIIGMSGQFPGADDLEQFWQLLYEQKEGISEIPSSRWDIERYYDADQNKPGKMNTRRAGLINNIADFDPSFFSITPKAAEYLDPQQRLLLKQTWHALENAALAPNELKGSDTGVFIGQSSHDYETLIIKNLSEEAINRQIAIGNSASTAAGRLSHFLGLEGPNLSLDTACSSSLVAVHQACEHLLRNECQLAIAGGVNALLSPYLFINFSKAGMLSTDGRCKTFDASANGYVRGEGCGIVILKRLSHALRDKNPILALIKASGYNQDGASGGLTVPNGEAQKKLLQKVLVKSQVSAQEIDYIECHGTGTPLGDPIEANAIASIYAEPRQQALLLGSVKTNIGHLEAAAGIAGLIKTVLALQHNLIPAHLNYEQMNPEIQLHEHIAIANQAQSWVRQAAKPRYAGVSSFGFSGTNAHLILSEAPELLSEEELQPNLASAHLFALSAKSETALKALIQTYINYLKHSKEQLANICYTLAVGRQHFNYRLACISTTKDELIAQLDTADLSQAAVKTSVEPLQERALNEVHRAYKEGKQIDWQHYYAPIVERLKPVLLPNYPFKKEAYWLPKKS